MVNISFNLGLGELIAIGISILGAWVSISIWMKDKPILHIEKQSASFNNNGKSSTFIFYLSNIGKQPTTIKEIKFYTKNNYTPNILLFESTKTIKPMLAEEGIEDLEIEGAKMPFQLLPYSAKLFQAELDFSSSETLKREHKEDGIRYWVKIKYTEKKDFVKFI